MCCVTRMLAMLLFVPNPTNALPTSPFCVRFQAPAPQPAAEEVADMRARICAGMKRYFHTKQTEGLLSNRVRATAQSLAAAWRLLALSLLR